MNMRRKFNRNIQKKIQAKITLIKLLNFAGHTAKQQIRQLVLMSIVQKQNFLSVVIISEQIYIYMNMYCEEKEKRQKQIQLQNRRGQLKQCLDAYAPEKSPHYPEYRQSVPPLTKTQLQRANKSLLQNHFTRTDSQQFNAVIQKVGQESILYEVNYGCFKTKLAFFISNLGTPKQIAREVIGAGSAGTVKQFKIEGEQVVAKIYRFSSSNLYIDEMIIKEIFMVKFASALQVGPAFIGSYSYDGIALGNACEFLMEYCPRPKQRISYSKSFYENLAIIHHFHLVHRDLKPDNIGWSHKKGKLIFLDFGYSKFIKEEVGQKTLSLYVGTFFYASKEMKNAYFLGEAKVDLYHNDLYAAQKTIEDLGIECSPMNGKIDQSQLNEYEEENGQVQNKCYEWSQLVPFFRLKFAIFMSHNEKIKQLMQNSSGNLRQSFLYIVKNEVIQPVKTQCLDILQKNYQYNPIGQFLKQKSIDKILYCMLNDRQKTSSAVYFDISTKNLEVLIKKQEIQLVWNQKNWIIKIFQYIFMEQMTNSTKFAQKGQLIRIIYSIQKLQEDSQYEKIMWCLWVFIRYFNKTKNIDMLLHLHLISTILLQYQRQLFIKIQICKRIEEQKDPMQYLQYLKSTLISMVVNPYYDLDQLSDIYGFDNEKNSSIGSFAQQLDLIWKYKMTQKAFSLSKLIYKFKEMKKMNLGAATSQILQKIEVLFKKFLLNLNQSYDLIEQLQQQQFRITHRQNAILQSELALPYSELTKNLYYLQSFARGQNTSYDDLKKLLKGHFILSTQEKSWSLPYLLRQKNYEKANQILLPCLSLTNEFHKLYLHRLLYFIPQIFQLFANSDKSFPYFQKFLANTKAQQFTNQSQICYYISLLSRFFSQLRNYQHFLCCKVSLKQIIVALKPIIKIVLICLKKSSKNENDLAYLLGEFTAFILVTLDGQDGEMIPSKLTQNLQKITDCISDFHETFFVYEWLQLIHHQLNLATQKKIQDLFFEKFSCQEGIGLTLLLLHSTHALLAIIQGFSKREQYFQMQMFLLKLYKQLNSPIFKELPLQSDNIFDFLSSFVPKKQIYNFTVQVLVKQKLELIQNCMLTIMIANILVFLKSQLSSLHQRRMIIMLSFGIAHSTFKQVSMKKLVAYLLKWHRKNEQMRHRKRMINFKKEMIYCIGNQSNFQRYANFRQKRMRVRAKKACASPFLLKKIKNLKSICKAKETKRNSQQ